MLYFELLPDELLAQILHNLNIDDIKNVLQLDEINEKLNRILTGYTFWKNKFELDMIPLENSESKLRSKDVNKNIREYQHARFAMIRLKRLLIHLIPDDYQGPFLMEYRFFVNSKEVIFRYPQPDANVFLDYAFSIMLNQLPNTEPLKHGATEKEYSIIDELYDKVYSFDGNLLVQIDLNLIGNENNKPDELYFEVNIEIIHGNFNLSYNISFDDGVKILYDMEYHHYILLDKYNLEPMDDRIKDNNNPLYANL